jgi:hypothetical protein
VDLRGFEPLASSVRLRRAPNCATGPTSSLRILSDAEGNVKNSIVAKFLYNIDNPLSKREKMTETTPHLEIHAGKYDSIKVKSRLAGEPGATETGTPGSERGVWKSASPASSAK